MYIIPVNYHWHFRVLVIEFLIIENFENFVCLGNIKIVFVQTKYEKCLNAMPSLSKGH